MTIRCAAFDAAAVCAGFVYGITIAGQFLQNGMYQRALVIGADTFSKVTDWNHRTCVIFGDAAGAVVLEKEGPGEGPLQAFSSPKATAWTISPFSPGTPTSP